MGVSVFRINWKLWRSIFRLSRFFSSSTYNMTMRSTYFIVPLLWIVKDYVSAKPWYMERYISNHQEQRPQKAQHIHYHIPVKFPHKPGVAYHYPGQYYYYHPYPQYQAANHLQKEEEDHPMEKEKQQTEKPNHQAGYMEETVENHSNATNETTEAEETDMTNETNHENHEETSETNDKNHEEPSHMNEITHMMMEEEAPECMYPGQIIAVPYNRCQYMVCVLKYWNSGYSQYGYGPMEKVLFQCAPGTAVSQWYHEGLGNPCTERMNKNECSTIAHEVNAN